jgi:hypothetical protein
MALKMCEHCGGEFEPYRPVQRFCSEKCRAASYYSTHREQALSAERKRYQAGHYTAHREKRKAMSLANSLKRKYGLSTEAYNYIAARQGFLCAICGDPETGVG